MDCILIVTALALVLAAGAGEAPPVPTAGGAVVVIDRPGGCDPIALGASGRQVVLALTADEAGRKAVDSAAAAAGRLGLVTAVAAPRLEHLPVADGLAVAVVVDDPAEAAGRGLAPAELLRICAARGAVVVHGPMPAGWSELAGTAGPDGWVVISRGLPAGQGEYRLPKAVDGGGGQVVDDAFAVRRNFISGWASPEANGPGTAEAGRSSGLLRWMDGIYQNRNGKGSTRGIAVGDGVTAICSADAISSWIRNGLYFIDRPASALVCRDAATGIVRWSRPSDAGSLAIQAGAVWAIEGSKLFAWSVVDGAQRCVVSGVDGRKTVLTASSDLVVLGGCKDRLVRAIDAASGSERWTVPSDSGGATVASLLMGDRQVIGQVGAHLIAWDRATGNESWRRLRADLGGGDLRAVGATVVVAATDRMLLLDPASGANRFAVAVTPIAKTRPAWTVVVADGRAVVNDATGIRAVDLASGAAQVLTATATSISGYGYWPCSRPGGLTTGLLRQLAGSAPAPAPALPEPLGSLPIASACGAGAVVAYGTAYSPMQGCACYVGRLPGTVAIQEARGIDPASLQGPGPLERGPAATPPAATGDGPWPTWRGDAQRSLAGAADPPAAPVVAWRTTLAQPIPPGPIATESWRGNWLYGPAISAPVSDGRLVVVALPAQHQVVALDLATGSERWRHTAGGPIDGPPTLHCGRAMFGCRDGRVTCLDLASGALVWSRPVVANTDRICVYGQLESRFPVSGPVLAIAGVVHASAGFSGQVGIARAAFDLETGEVKSWAWLPRAVQLNDALVIDGKGSPWLGYVPLDGPIPTGKSGKSRPVLIEPGLETLIQGKVLPGHLIPADLRLLSTHRSSQPAGHVPVTAETVNGKLKTTEAATLSDGSLPLQRGASNRLGVLSTYLEGLPAVTWSWDAQGRIGLRSAPERLPGSASFPDWGQVAVGEVFSVAHGTATPAWHSAVGPVWALAITPGVVVTAGPVVSAAAAPTATGAATAGEASAWGAAKPYCIDPLTAPGRITLIDRASGRILRRIDLPAAPVADGLAMIPGAILASLADGSLALLR